MVEMALAMAIMSMVVFFGTVALVSTLQAWERGQARISSETEATAALRYVRDQLKEAMSVTVDGDGKGLTYRLATKDDSGNYTYPLTYDGVSRRFQLNSDGTFVQIVAGKTKVLLTGVTTTDHRGDLDTGSYQVFVGGAGAITRTLTVQLVTKNLIRSHGGSSNNTYGRVREIILLRNTPQISQ